MSPIGNEPCVVHMRGILRIRPVPSHWPRSHLEGVNVLKIRGRLPQKLSPWMCLVGNIVIGLARSTVCCVQCVAPSTRISTRTRTRTGTVPVPLPLLLPMPLPVPLPLTLPLPLPLPLLYSSVQHDLWASSQSEVRVPKPGYLSLSCSRMIFVAALTLAGTKRISRIGNTHSNINSNNNGHNNSTTDDDNNAECCLLPP